MFLARKHSAQLCSGNRPWVALFSSETETENKTPWIWPRVVSRCDGEVLHRARHLIFSLSNTFLCRGTKALMLQCLLAQLCPWGPAAQRPLTLNCPRCCQPQLLLQMHNPFCSRSFLHCTLQ